ncbi:MAG: DUF4861 family protein [Prevotella sp.]|nr:DUF4861 family protein [Prevotella sp.]
MGKVVFTCIMALICRADARAQFAVEVENPTEMQRQEVVEADAAGLPSSFVVRNVMGQEVGYQLSHDGKLLLDVAVQPFGKAVYTIEEGVPSKPKWFVCGNKYAIRKDDIAWENDRGAYRLYGPALQQTGERSFGIDVWVKNTPELVVERRYLADYYGNIQEDSLYKAGLAREARNVDLATSFHLDRGDGMDCYAVGASLGCGAPALMVGDSIVFPYCYHDYQILDNGPLRFKVQLDYGHEHRVVSLDKGSNFNKMTVWYDQLPKERPVSLVSGVVLHGGNQVELGGDYVQYADPTDHQAHQSQVYVAVLFPAGVAETRVIKGEHDHAVGVVRDYNGAPYTYYFGSAWSQYDVRTQAEWQLRISEYLHARRHPLTVKIKKTT